MVTLAGIVILGIFAQWVAWRIKMPSILPLIVIGLMAGPLASLDFVFGEKLLDPNELFKGKTLNYFVSLAVGIILFEGGLTLRLKEVKNVATTVRNLIIFQSIIALIGGALAVFYILGFSPKIALLFGALIIVTGPTVIAPILRNVQAEKKVSTILRWESIVIDPIGALIAVLMYEFIISGAAGTQFTLTALLTFGKTILAGVFMGAFCAWLLYFLLKKNLVPNYLINVVSLALVFVAFVGSDLIAHEGGLLAVTLMGMIIANIKISQFHAILHFKESLTVLLVSILFIILSANIDIEQLQMLGWSSLIILAIVIYVLRPLSVFISSINSNLSFQQKIFISWIGPRGIVAAAIASIFAISILEQDVLTVEERRDAELLIPLTFLIILGTVILQGTSAKFVAKKLGLIKRDGAGFTFLGAHEAARLIAKYLHDNDVNVTLIDTSHTNANEAKLMGLKVLERNIFNDEIMEDLEINDVGTFMGLTSNNEINISASRKFKKEFGSKNVYRLITRNEIKFTSLVRPKYILFSPNADFYKLIELSRKYPEIKELPIKDASHLEKMLESFTDQNIPLFLKSKEEQFKVITADHHALYEPGDELIYMGKKL